MLCESIVAERILIGTGFEKTLLIETRNLRRIRIFDRGLMIPAAADCIDEPFPVIESKE